MYCVAKTKALISCMVTVQLICAFVFTYARKTGFLMTRLKYLFQRISKGSLNYARTESRVSYKTKAKLFSHVNYPTSLMACIQLMISSQTSPVMRKPDYVISCKQHHISVYTATQSDRSHFVICITGSNNISTLYLGFMTPGLRYVLCSLIDSLISKS